MKRRKLSRPVALLRAFTRSSIRAIENIGSTLLRMTVIRMVEAFDTTQFTQCSIPQTINGILPRAYGKRNGTLFIARTEHVCNRS